MPTKIQIPKSKAQIKRDAVKEYREYVKENPNPNTVAALRSEVEKLRKIVLGE